MKLAARIALIAGLSVMILLIAHEGALGIIKLLSKAGWMLLLLLPLHVLPLLLDAAGWRAISEPHVRVGARRNRWSLTPKMLLRF